jgi:succinyl-CoA synthetase alpha subunit
VSILLDSESRFIVQGITGRHGSEVTRGCLDYGRGARIVAGVTPGRGGDRVHGVPVLDTVGQALAHHGMPVEGSVVAVPPDRARDAVFEALEHGVKLVVVASGGVPRLAVAQMVELASLRGARIVGPRSVGIAVPEVVKIGALGGPAADAQRAFRAGPVGVMARAAGLLAELASMLSAAGLGQSTAVAIGGDAIVGSTYAELMPLFEADEETAALIVASDRVGPLEAELARWVAENDTRLPVVAYVADDGARAQAEAVLGVAGIAVTASLTAVPDLVRARLGGA